jgi:hypothetical protein
MDDDVTFRRGAGVHGMLGDVVEFRARAPPTPFSSSLASGSQEVGLE